MSSDPSAFAGTWALTMQTPDGNQYTMSLNIQVSPDLVHVVVQNPQGTVEADHVVFADGVLNCSIPVGDSCGRLRVAMRQDGNIDVLVDYYGMMYSSVGSRAVGGN
jgi:hypothetical protein